MRRAVITGLGIVSSIGINQEQVTASLKAGKSGITFSEEFAEMGLRSQVWGNVDIDFKEHIDRKAMRFMGDAAAYAYVAMQQAVADSGLEESEVSNIRTGIVAGSGGHHIRIIHLRVFRERLFMPLVRLLPSFNISGILKRLYAILIQLLHSTGDISGNFFHSYPFARHQRSRLGLWCLSVERKCGESRKTQGGGNE